MMQKHVMIVDNSVAVQEMCKQVLLEKGYKVSVASNGIAAVSNPDIENIDLLLIDSQLNDFSGLETTKQIKTDSELSAKPVLLLVPEDQCDDRESKELMGANAWIKKPFSPDRLIEKTQLLLEEQEILKQAKRHLAEAADNVMRRLAQEHILKAVEDKTQIMVERALQMVVTQVDQKAKKEVDSKVTQLVSEKESELVKATVQEVARSTVEKLADKRVTESMDRILADETQRAVKGLADEIIPTLVQMRVKDGIDQILPREVSRRVQKEAEELVPETSQKVIGIINVAANNIVPNLAKELVKEQADVQISGIIDNQLPRQVQFLVNQEIDNIVRQKMEPYLKKATASLRRRITILMLIFFVIVGAMAATLWADYMFGPFIQRPSAPPAESVNVAANQSQPADTTAEKQNPVGAVINKFFPGNKSESSSK